MPEEKLITEEQHKQQIEAYTKERPQYKVFADALKGVLEQACRISCPEALIQARAKTISSFAEKVVRRFDKYQDAVHQFTDLSGARVVVQTAEQVRAVRAFIEANFEILEKDDKVLRLSDDEFGYRDMHYIVRLRSDRAQSLGFKPAALKAIGDKRAEIQVRTWLQHAWADTLHDRMYKNDLTVSSETRRTGALLAALMEEGDRNLNVLADNLDGLIANYTAFSTRASVLEEIKIQRLIFHNEPEAKNKPRLSLKLARLLAAVGDHQAIVDLLSPYQTQQDANQAELLLTLGYSVCRLNRVKPKSQDYELGVDKITRAARLLEILEVKFVPRLRWQRSLHARALYGLGWALAKIPGREGEARERFRQAHEDEPGNPYYLAAMLGFELHFGRDTLPESMRTTIREAIRTCREHGEAKIELPYAYFAAGRLSLLLGQSEDAFGYYARGIRHSLAGVYCMPPELLQEEVDWIIGIHYGERQPPPESQRLLKLLALAGRSTTSTRSSPSYSLPVVLVAGGARSLDPALRGKIIPLLVEAFSTFSGTVISGGTTIGVPGAVGDAACDLKARRMKRFHLFGYLPERLPRDVSVHPAYDEYITRGRDFTAEQILSTWSDLLKAGVRMRDVYVLGFGGGQLSAIEYHIALGLGATVGLVAGTGGRADQLLAAPLWTDLPNLYELPFDTATIRAFVKPPDPSHDPPNLKDMAMQFHAEFIAQSKDRLPENLRPWTKLGETYQQASIEQARYAQEILDSCGYKVVPSSGPKVFIGFTKGEVEGMAEREHGRWNIERLSAGWRPGKLRDNARKRHDCLVSWKELPNKIKEYDRASIRALPKILASAGLEIRRSRTRKKAFPKRLPRQPSRKGTG